MHGCGHDKRGGKLIASDTLQLGVFCSLGRKCADLAVYRPETT
jgi:hypothetical protein